MSFRTVTEKPSIASWKTTSAASVDYDPEKAFKVDGIPPVPSIPIELDAISNRLSLSGPPKPAPAPAPAPSSVPDGGFKAWSTVFGAWLVLFCTFGYFNAFGVYEAFYVSSYLDAQTPSNISWVGSIQLSLQFAFGLVSGRLFDAGYFHHILAVGSFIYVVCLFMLSLAKEQQYYQVILSQGVGLGIGLGIVFVPSISVVNHHFSKKRALATGIVFSGSSVGGLIFPIMINKLLESKGFAWTVRASGFMVLGLLVIANFCMTTRMPPKQDSVSRPKVDLRKIVKDVPYIVGVLGGFCVQWGLFFPFFYLELYSQSHGVSETLSFYTVAILNAGSLFGRILPNFLADKFGVINLLIPCAAAIGALIFAMFGTTSPGGVIAFAILYGFFSGAFISLLGLMFVTMADGVHEIGTRIGIAFLVIAFAALTGTPIDGALLGEEFVWYKAIIFSGTVVFVGVGLLIVTRFMMVKKKGTYRV